MENKPLILVTNDDGIGSKGIKSLVEVAKQYGDVLVVAPDSPQSGMGHAITINHPLRLNKSNAHGEITAYSCSGTPVDCVKLAIYEVLKRKPDFLVSGINHGSNCSTNVLYSGTMSAAIEGALEGIPSIGFSLLDFERDADFDGSKETAKKVLGKVIDKGMPKGMCLNVNIPKLKSSDIKGIKICRQAKASWEDKFDARKDQFGKDYYWLTGEFVNHDKGEDSDIFALKNGYVSVVPTQFDLTAHHAITQLNDWEL